MFLLLIIVILFIALFAFLFGLHSLLALVLLVGFSSLLIFGWLLDLVVVASLPVVIDFCL